MDDTAGAVAHALLGTTLQQTYTVERLIGRGGMGEVFEASHTRLRRRFAIKVLRDGMGDLPNTMQRFRREAEICSEIGHPHIVEVIDFNHLPDGSPYVVMELLEGEDLAQRLRRVGRIPLAEMVDIFHQAASALHAVHQRGVVHRDLKPENLFLARVDEEIVVKVVDFGISKILGAGTLTNANTTFGTPWYMAPEQAEGHTEQVDCRTDVFAMGALLYHVLSGQLPFNGDSLPAVLYKVVHVSPPPLCDAHSEIPRPVSDVVMRALSKQPADRWPTVKEMDRALFRAAAAGMPSGRVQVGDAQTLVGQGPPPAASVSLALDETQATGETPAVALDETLPSGETPALALDETQAPGETPARTATGPGDGGLAAATMPPAGPARRRTLVLLLTAGLGIAALIWVVAAALRSTPSGPPRVSQGITAVAADGGEPQRPAPSPDVGPPRKSKVAATPTSQPASRGTLWLTANVAGARVVVDGAPLGVVPLRGVQLPPDWRRLTVRHPGYRTWTHAADGTAGEVRLKVRLVPLSTVVQVISLCQGEPVWGAVRVDGKPMGHTPRRITLRPGTHEISVIRAGYRRASRRVRVRPGEQRRVVLHLQRE